MLQNSLHIYQLGDNAISIQFGNEINESINQKILALFNHIEQQKIAWINDIVPAYTTLTIVYDAMLIYKTYKPPSINGFVRQQATSMIDVCNSQGKAVLRQIEIPVCYDESFALDIKNLALQKSISVEEVIRLHTSKTYRVYMIGFLPGFAYMASVDEQLVAPRLSNPRINVAAGSVGIAGEQTGIYPLDSPGGWNIIGRTPLQLFDARKENPVPLQLGDEIKFMAISMEEFHKNYKHIIS